MRLAVPLLILAALALPAALLAKRRPAHPPPASRAAAAGGGDDAAAAPPLARAAAGLARGRLPARPRAAAAADRAGFATWDPILKQVGNRPWRRWGTDRLLRTLHLVLGAYARAIRTRRRC